MKKNRVPSKQEIETKKEALLKLVNETIEKIKQGRSSPSTDFLLEIKEIIKEMIDNGVSYKKISIVIYQIYSFKISEQTIRAFAHSVLNVPVKIKLNKKSSSEIKSEIAKKTRDDNEVTLWFLSQSIAKVA